MSALVEVRGLGLMVASELDDPQRTAAIVNHCLTESRLILMTAGAAIIGTSVLTSRSVRSFDATAAYDAVGTRASQRPMQ